MASRAERLTPTNTSPAAAISLISVRAPGMAMHRRPSAAFTASALAKISSYTSPPPAMRNCRSGTALRSRGAISTSCRATRARLSSMRLT